MFKDKEKLHNYNYKHLINVECQKCIMSVFALDFYVDAGISICVPMLLFTNTGAIYLNICIPFVW